jgi:RNA polymerase sigma-70 factor (ECF subfamily)
MVSGREEAEDVVQDTFVRAYEKLNAFRQDSSFYTWLYRIAVNTALYRQRQRRQEPAGEPPQPSTEPSDPLGSPTEHLLRAERARDVRLALTRLAEEFRLVLVMRDVEGFDYQTIARILDISVGTVRSRLHRARSNMRELLRHHHQGSRPE